MRLCVVANTMFSEQHRRNGGAVFPPSVAPVINHVVSSGRAGQDLSIMGCVEKRPGMLVSRRTTARRHISATVQCLTGHQRSQAELCLSCGKRVSWSKRAVYLPDKPELVRKVNEHLQPPLTVDLNDSTRPTSLCGSCVAALNGKVVPTSFKNRLTSQMTVPLSAHVSDGTRGCKQHSCNICVTANFSPSGNLRQQQKRQPESKSDKENVPAQPMLATTPVSLATSAPTSIAADVFVRATYSAGYSGRSSGRFAKALARESSGDVVVSPGTKDLITRHNKLLLPFLSTTALDSAPDSCCVYVSDMRGAISALVTAAKIVPDAISIIRANTDWGGGSGKMSFSFLKVTNVSSQRVDGALADTGVR